MSVMRCVHGNKDECAECHEAKVVSIVSPRYAPSRPDNERAKECDWNDGTGDGGVCMALVDGEYVECADACSCVSFKAKPDSERVDCLLKTDGKNWFHKCMAARAEIQSLKAEVKALASTQATP